MTTLSNARLMPSLTTMFIISVKDGQILKYVSEGAEFKGFMYKWLQRVSLYHSTHSTSGT